MSGPWIVWVAWLALSVFGHAGYRARMETADPEAAAVVEAMENVAVREVTLKALDVACAQSGYRWSVAFNGETGGLLVLIER